MSKMSLRFNARVGASRGPKASAKASMAQVISSYRALVGHVENIVPDILYEALVPTFEKSQVYCPVDTGALRDSGYLRITKFRGIPTVEMGYGKGGRPEYTARVHEELEWRHKAPTRAKWLQVALAEDENAVADRIVSALKQVGF